MKILSIKELTAHIKQRLESDQLLNNVWLKGEISNFKHHSSGHMYFTLKDSSAAIKSVMFRSRNQTLIFRPQDGMAVLARGNVTVYERDGQYQLYVDEMQPHGVGSLHVAFLQLKEKLEKEGLFHPSRKRPLPGFPRKVGVVTSPTGAAVRDIINVLTRRYPQVHIIIVPVAVQGDGAPRQISDGIRIANLLTDIDVLIVGRGGGSIEELWAFNTEEVARAIFESVLPVISAVGHETDFTIADFVADMRAPTPSAAAEMVVPDRREVQKYLDTLSGRLAASTRKYLSFLREKVKRAKESTAMKRPKDNLQRKTQDLDKLHRRLAQSIELQLDRKKSAVALQATHLDSLSPLATLKRGYGICLRPDGTTLRKAGMAKTGDEINVVLSDGIIDCMVTKIKGGLYGQGEE